MTCINNRPSARRISMIFYIPEACPGGWLSKKTTEETIDVSETGWDK